MIEGTRPPPTDQPKSSWLKPAIIWPILWALLITVTSSGVVTVGQLSQTVSSVAGGRITESEFRQVWGAVWWFFVKGWHAAEFGILYLLFRKALTAYPKWAWILAGIGAIGDELHQMFVADRGSRVSDICIDWLGILAVWAICEYRANRSPIKSRWLMVGLTVLWIALVFVLSIYPFGLMSLNPNSQGKFQP